MLKSILTSHYNRMILLIIILTVIYISLIIAKAFGETEQECTIYSSSHLKVLGIINLRFISSTNGCDWLVDKFLYNGSGFNISGYQLGGDKSQSYQTFVLTKK